MVNPGAHHDDSYPLRSVHEKTPENSPGQSQQVVDGKSANRDKRLPKPIRHQRVNGIHQEIVRFKDLAKATRYIPLRFTPNEVIECSFGEIRTRQWISSFHRFALFDHKNVLEPVDCG